MNENLIIIYSKKGCKYCDLAKAYMLEENINHEVINLDMKAEAYPLIREKLIEESDGHKTFPWIFVENEQGKTFLGGYNKFYNMHSNLELEKYGLVPDF